MIAYGEFSRNSALKREQCARVVHTVRHEVVASWPGNSNQLNFMHVPRADLLRKNRHVTRGILSLSHVLENQSYYYRLLARKIAQAVITLRQFLYIRYILRTFLIFLLKDARIIEGSVSTVLLEIDVEKHFSLFNINKTVTDLVLVIFSRELFFIHVKISHSYTRNYLKIWKDKILKSVITWYEMGQQTTQSKNVCLKLSENKSIVYRYWQLCCMIVMWDTYNT